MTNGEGELFISGKCLPKCVHYQNSLKNMSGQCHFCKVDGYIEIEKHMARYHKEFIANLREPLKKILKIATDFDERNNQDNLDKQDN